MTNQSGRVFLLILLVGILGLGIYSLVSKGEQQDKQAASEPTNRISKNDDLLEAYEDYMSEALRIKFKIPKNAQVEEKSTILLISLNSGEISITRNGTNYENPKDYYDDLKEKNKLSPLSYHEGSKDNYNYVVTTDEATKDSVKKTYYIYKDDKVFAISANDKTLYPVLDQLVQSFEYTP